MRRQDVGNSDVGRLEQIMRREDVGNSDVGHSDKIMRREEVVNSDVGRPDKIYVGKMSEIQALAVLIKSCVGKRL